MSADATQTDEYVRFVHHARHHLERQQRRIRSVMRAHVRYTYRGSQLTLHGRSLPLLSTRVVLAGRYDQTQSLWRWGWGEPDLQAEELAALEDLRAVGEARGFTELVRASWVARKKDAWDMASIAAMVLDGRGVFCAEAAPLSSFYVLLDPLSFESVAPPAECEW